ncbi:MAG TPA: hypothetical protein DEB06_04490 [Phycisphaerales bacterium]|nr:hypothetical protein [Phycisphaerales bacterium]
MQWAAMWCAVMVWLVCAVPVFAQGARAPKPPARFLELTVTNRSEVSEGAFPLFIAADGLGWNSAGIAAGGPLGGPPGKPGGWWFLMPRDRADAIAEFKFTRGTWDTVEIDAQGKDIANRRLPDLDWSATSDADPMLRLEFVVEGFADERGMRWPLEKRASTVTGTLHIEEFKGAIIPLPRMLRVWVPPGYDAPENAERRYPMLFMHDGQNLFDEATSFAGEWRLDETATELIEKGEIEPFIAVGIDNAGPDRANEYLPLPAGRRLPRQGGLGDAYIGMIRREIEPWVASRYRTAPGRVYMGGSSFGGIATLHAAMSQPGWLSGMIVESPSLWVGDGAFMEAVQERCEWPARIFTGMGDTEYGRWENDDQLINLFGVLCAAFRGCGVEEPNLLYIAGKGDKHNEQAWAKRLPFALRQMFGEIKPK